MINFGVTAKKQQALAERMGRCGVRGRDLEEKFVRGSGPGGRKGDTSSSCVQLCHKPSGIEVHMQKERSQGLNRYYARKRLCELLEKRQQGNASPEGAKAAKIRKQKQRRKRRSSSGGSGNS